MVVKWVVQMVETKVGWKVWMKAEYRDWELTTMKIARALF